MKNGYLFIFLIMKIFINQAEAMSPRTGGATGGAAAAPDISKCDLNPSKQTKVKVKGKDGKDHFICTGQAVCGGNAVPVSCKVSEREPCPLAKQCIVFTQSLIQSAQQNLLDDYKVKCVELPEIAPREFNEIFSQEKLEDFKPMVRILSPQQRGLQDNSLLEPKGNYTELIQPNNNYDHHSESKKLGEAYRVSENIGAYKPVGQITIRFQNRTNWKCSAGLIWLPSLERYGLVTAAHCVYLPESKLWADSLVYWSNMGFPDNYVFKRIKVKKFFLSYGWIQNDINKVNLFDYAILILDQTPEKLETLGLSIYPNKNLIKGTSVGFPGKGRFGDRAEIKYAVDIPDFYNSPANRFLGTLFIKQDMHDGTSGGPWVGHGNGRRFGFIFSLNSFHYDDQKDNQYGPSFGKAIENQLQSAINVNFPCEKLR